jgi:hypothetical protein
MSCANGCLFRVTGHFLLITVHCQRCGLPNPQPLSTRQLRSLYSWAITVGRDWAVMG